MDEFIKYVLNSIFSAGGIYAIGFLWAFFERWQHIQRDKWEREQVAIARALEERQWTILEGLKQLIQKGG